MCDLILKNCMLDIQLSDNNVITKEKIETFIWDVSSHVGALLISLPLVVQFPLSLTEVERCIEEQEKERKEHSIMAKRIKEILVARTSTVTGFSGIGLYEKANCSIHVWPEKGFMTFDVSNIIEFKNNDVFESLYRHFDIDKVSGLSVNRYHKKPQKVEIVNNF